MFHKRITSTIFLSFILFISLNNWCFAAEEAYEANEERYLSDSNFSKLDLPEIVEQYSTRPKIPLIANQRFQESSALAGVSSQTHRSYGTALREKLSNTSSILVVSCALMGGSYYWFPKTRAPIKHLMNSFLISQIMGELLKRIALEQLDRLRCSLLGNNFSSRRVHSNAFRILNQLQQKIESMPEATQQQIEYKDYAQKSLSQLIEGFQEETKTKLSQDLPSIARDYYLKRKNFIGGLNLFLLLPTLTKRFDRHFRLRQKRLDHVLSFYSSQEKLNQTAQAMLVRTHLLSLTSDESRPPLPKQAFYLSGPAGVGKTAFIKAFAVATDTPLAEVTCDPSDVVAFTTTFYSYSAGLASHPLDDFKETNKLTTAILSACDHEGRSSKCFILLFDEVDKLVLDHGTGDHWKKFFLKLCDSNENSIFLKDFGVNFDLSRCLIIFSGNRPKGDYPADFASRLSEIPFEAIDPKLKKTILFKEAKKIITKLPIEISGYTDTRLNRAIDLILQRNRHNPGIRESLSDLREYILSLYAQELGCTICGAQEEQEDFSTQSPASVSNHEESTNSSAQQPSQAYGNSMERLLGIFAQMLGTQFENGNREIVGSLQKIETCLQRRLEDSSGGGS